MTTSKGRGAAQQRAPTAIGSYLEAVLSLERAWWSMREAVRQNPSIGNRAGEQQAWFAYQAAKTTFLGKILPVVPQ